MNMYYFVRMCEVALQAHASNLKIDPADEALRKMSCEQYALFSPGEHEWPALLRRADRQDPSYKN
ncbi:MAG: hypothetical protein ACI88H_000758 [Cocleimonas sp.]|jgi:hypothetical protein